MVSASVVDQNDKRLHTRRVKGERRIWLDSDIRYLYCGHSFLGRYLELVWVEID